MSNWTCQEVLGALGIPEVKRTGERIYYRCPIHKPDNDPSLEVSPKGWLCGPCGAKGANAYQLLAFCSGISPDNRSAILDEAKRIGLLNGNGYEKQPESPRDIVARYSYTDPNGKVLYQKIRRRNKEFAFYNQDQDVWERGTTPVLYNLKNLIGKKAIYFCEGEKDADNLIRLGFDATTTDSGGSKNYESQHLIHAPFIKDKLLYIFYDNDKAGREYSRSVAMNNYGNAAGIFIIELPEMGEGEDVSDFIGRISNSVEAKSALQRLIDDALPWSPAVDELAAIQAAKTKQWELDAELFELVELGVLKHAQNFVNLYRGRLYWSSKHDTYYLWDGKIFVPTHPDKLLACVAEIFPELFSMRSTVSRELQKKITQAIKRTGVRLLNDILKLSKPKLEIDAELFDRRPHLINFSNGTLDLDTSEFRLHSRSDLLTMMLPYDYDTEATCPLFEAHMERFQPDPEIRNFIQLIFGLCTTGDTQVQRIFEFIGGGGNGKTTTLEAITEAMGGLGKGYVAKVPAILLLSGAEHDRSMQMKAELRGVRLVIASELEDDRAIKDDFIKEVTGDRDITARYLHGKHFSYKRQFKIIMIANERPIVRKNTNAIWRRITLVPWDIEIPAEEMDESFGEKLEAERAGIMNWLVAGALRYIDQERFELPAAIEAAIREYRDAEDTITQMLNEFCERDNGEYMFGETPRSVLYKMAIQWAKDNGYKQLSLLSQTKFSQQLLARGVQSSNMTVRFPKGQWFPESKVDRAYLVQLRPEKIEEWQKSNIPQRGMFQNE